MEHRCEPMGGEGDCDQVIGSNGANSNDVVDTNNESFDSFSNDTFVDDLTLKVRSLLMSVDDHCKSITEENTQCLLQGNQIYVTASQSFSELREDFNLGTSSYSNVFNNHSNNFTPESYISGDLKCTCKDALNVDCEIVPKNSYEDPGFSSKGQESQNIMLENVSNYSSHVKKSKLWRSDNTKFLDNLQKSIGNKPLNLPKIFIEEREEGNISMGVQSATGDQMDTIEDCASYNTFSNTLPKVNITVEESQTSKLNSYFKPQPHGQKYEPYLFEETMEKAVKRHDRENNKSKNYSTTHSLLNPVVSTDLCSRYESLEKEAERSWSEITVVTESFTQPQDIPSKASVLSNKNKSDFSQLCLPRYTKVVDPNTTYTDSFTNISRVPMTSDHTDSNGTSVTGWRLNLPNSVRMVHEPERESEVNYCSFSSVSDFDQIDRETPPLSASSVASSRRLEWDNGADIGYSVAILNPKFKGKRMIPKMARSEPEGISLLNETSNVNPSSYQTSSPYFNFPASNNPQIPPTSADVGSQNSCIQTDEDDLLERSSSPGSLSRSDSKKSVIYNSVRDMYRQSKAFDSSTGDSFEPYKNLSCPNLVELENSSVSHDLAKLSKSEEQVSKTKQLRFKSSVMKTFHFPGLTSERSNFHTKKTAHVYEVSERTVDGPNKYEEESMKADSEENLLENLSHTCKNCQSSINVKDDHATSNVTHSSSQNVFRLRSGTLESFAFLPENSSTIPIYNDEVSPEDTMAEWIDESAAFNSDLHYISEFPENYQFQELHSRPMLFVSNSPSKLEDSKFPRIVRSFLNNSNTSDPNTAGNSEMQPHIRWYPVTSASATQDIKNVSTQTAVSFIAQQVKESPVQAVFEQQTSSPEEVTFETSGLSVSQFSFIEMPDMVTIKTHAGEGINIPNISTVSDSSVHTFSSSLSQVFNRVSRNQNVNEESSNPFSNSAIKDINLESVALSNQKMLSVESNDVSRTQTCKSCEHKLNTHFDNPSSFKKSLNLADNESSYNAYNHSKTSLRDAAGSSNEKVSDSLANSYPVVLLQSRMSPNCERKLGVGECQTIPKSVHDDSISSGLVPKYNIPRKDSMAPSLLDQTVPDTSSFVTSDTGVQKYIQQSNAPPENASVRHTDTVRNIVRAFNQHTTKLSDVSNNHASKLSGIDNHFTTKVSDTSTQQTFKVPDISSDYIQSSGCNNQHTLKPSDISNHPTISSDICNQHVYSDPQKKFVKTAKAIWNESQQSDPLRFNTAGHETNTLQKRLATYGRIHDSIDTKNGSTKISLSNQKHTSANVSNLLEFLSTKRPFSEYKFIENKERIPKSYSDPLITIPDDSSSEDGDSTITYQSHVYDRLDSGDQTAKHKERCKPEILYQNSSLIKQTKPKENITSVQDNILEKNLPMKFGSNSLFVKRDYLYDRHKRVDIQANQTPCTFDKSINSTLSREKNENLQTEMNNGKSSSTTLSQLWDNSDSRDHLRPKLGNKMSPSNLESEYSKTDSLVGNRNYASVGIQVSVANPEMEKCTFCHQTRNAHLSQCFQKDKFKAVLNQTLEKRLLQLKSVCNKSGTSFCVFSTGCVCCCNKTLQEAFNCHRSELVDRIEARKKEVENRTKKSFFLNFASTSHTTQKHQNLKPRLKPATAKSGVTDRPYSNKENIKKTKKSYVPPLVSSAKQKGRQKSLNKYNRVMSKLYSQRLKNETLKGKTNFHRNEILMNS